MENCFVRNWINLSFGRRHGVQFSIFASQAVLVSSHQNEKLFALEITYSWVILGNET